MDSAVPSAHVELSGNTRTAFSILSDAMKAECSENDTYFLQLTEFHEMETGESLLGNVDVVLTDPPFNLQSKTGKAKLRT